VSATAGCANAAQQPVMREKRVQINRLTGDQNSNTLKVGFGSAPKIIENMFCVWFFDESRRHRS
jgi:hypothetical protein